MMRSWSLVNMTVTMMVIMMEVKIEVKLEVKLEGKGFCSVMLRFNARIL